MTSWTDTHCHIHEEGYPDPEGAYTRAIEAGVQRLICVGTDEKSSREAVEFAGAHGNVWASVGLHPHDATGGVEALKALEELLETGVATVASVADSLGANYDSVLPRSAGNAESLPDAAVTTPAGASRKIVAIGECGLDYFYDNSPREKQIEMLHAQLELAQKYNLPVIFHVRESFTDFWPIFDAYQGLRGILHSFTDNLSNLEQGLSRGLLIGVNGISTFTKSEAQREMFRSIPLESVVFETDAPFLTPVPYRGQPNEPRHILSIAEHFADLKGAELGEVAAASEASVGKLFKIIS